MKELKAFILAAVTIAILVWLSGCQTPKRIQRQDDKAVARVVSKEPLLARVAKHISTGGDTVKIVTERTVTDTVLVPQPIHPQTCDECERYINSLVFATDRVIDTLLPGGIRLRISGSGIVATYVQRTQSLTTRDRRAEQRLQDSVAAWQQRYYSAQAALANAEAQNSKLQQIIAQLEKNLQAVKKKTGWPWWTFTLIGLVVGALGTATVLQKALPVVLIIKGLTAILALFKKKS
jgi:hypothetical protein